MGKVLQIRVSAVTWNEGLVEEYWPSLVRLAGSVPVKSEERGVLELVRRLDEGLRFMKWSEARKRGWTPWSAPISSEGPPFRRRRAAAQSRPMASSS